MNCVNNDNKNLLYITPFQWRKNSWNPLVRRFVEDEWKLKRNICLTTNRKLKNNVHATDIQGKRAMSVIINSEENQKNDWEEKKDESFSIRHLSDEKMCERILWDSNERNLWRANINEKRRCKYIKNRKKPVR